MLIPSLVGRGVVQACALNVNGQLGDYMEVAASHVEVDSKLEAGVSADRHVVVDFALGPQLKLIPATPNAALFLASGEVGDLGELAVKVVELEAKIEPGVRPEQNHVVVPLAPGHQLLQHRAIQTTALITVIGIHGDPGDLARHLAVVMEQRPEQGLLL